MIVSKIFIDKHPSMIKNFFKIIFITLASFTFILTYAQEKKFLKFDLVPFDIHLEILEKMGLNDIVNYSKATVNYKNIIFFHFKNKKNIEIYGNYNEILDGIHFLNFLETNENKLDENKNIKLNFSSLTKDQCSSEMISHILNEIFNTFLNIYSLTIELPIESNFNENHLEKISQYNSIKEIKILNIANNISLKNFKNMIYLEKISISGGLFKVSDIKEFKFENLREFSINSQSFDKDCFLEIINKYPLLESIYIKNTLTITNKELDQIQNLTNLKSLYLDIYSYNIPIHGIFLLKLENLENLYIGCATLSDIFYFCLGYNIKLKNLYIQLPKLKNLNHSNRIEVLKNVSPINDRIISKLRNLINLKILVLFNSSITDAGFNIITSKFKNLEELILKYDFSSNDYYTSSYISKHSFLQLLNLKNLKRIDIFNIKIGNENDLTDFEIENFLKSFNSMDYFGINLEHNVNITELTLTNLNKLKNLKCLKLALKALSSDKINLLKDLNKLVYIKLSTINCDLNDPLFKKESLNSIFPRLIKFSYKINLPTN